MEHLRNFLALGLAVLALSACAKTSMKHGGSSETHFLAQCTASCDQGYSCLCGVCTEACSGDDACEALNGNATCQAAAADGCGTETVCDVECNADGDCEALGAQHTCDDGRCRAPMVMVAQDAGAPPAQLSECTTDGVAELLVDVGAPNCGAEAGATPSEVARCVLDRQASDEPSFFVKWREQGVDSVLERGYAGSGTIYELYFDSIGFSDGEGGPVWMTSWVPCREFSIRESCETLAECFICEPMRGQMCGCNSDGLTTSCQDEPPACGASDCVIDGICYPDGETTEDGCCTCTDGVAGCIDPAWCPSWPLLGKRCETIEQCQLSGSSGLECHTSLVRPVRSVCSRPCNFGCPTGTECAQIEAASGELCLRTCQSNADCNIDVFGGPLGSECVGGYCL